MYYMPCMVLGTGGYGNERNRPSLLSIRETVKQIKYTISGSDQSYINNIYVGLG